MVLKVDGVAKVGSTRTFGPPSKIGLEGIDTPMDIQRVTGNNEDPNEVWAAIKAKLRIPDRKEGYSNTEIAKPTPTSSLPTVINNFDNFIVRKGTEEAFAACKKMAENPQGWLVLQGPRGCGKTHLLSAIGNAWYNKVYHPRTTASLLDIWRGRFDHGDFMEWFDGHCNMDNMVVDDLGTEKPTDWAVERLTMLLDHRYGRQLPTVISTNLVEEEMARVLGPRIADRVFDRGSGLCKIVAITASSYRTGRAW